MSPEQILAMVTAIVTLINQVGAAPLIVCMMAPLIIPWMILVLVSLAQHRRFEAVVKMYENNFTQSESFKALTEGYSRMTKGYEELVKWSTAEVTDAKNVALNNMHCPIVRKHARPKDLQDGE